MASNFEQRDNSGAIYVNDRKESENHPDRTGKVMVDGKMYYINGWIKKSGDKPPFMSLSFKLIEGQGQQTKKASNKPARDDEGDPDGIPF